MQDRIFRIIIFLIIVLSILHSGVALKCYKCLVPECENGPYEEKECLAFQTLCAKFTVEFDGVTFVGRTCGVPNACQNVRHLTKTCDECSTDLCNASANNAVSTIMIITSGLITLLWTIQ